MEERKLLKVSTSRPIEVIDTIYPVVSSIHEDRKGVSEVSFSAIDEVTDEDAGRIPFRMFIREEDEVCPCYSQVKNRLSVDVRLWNMCDVVATSNQCS